MPATSLLASMTCGLERLLAREGEQPAGQRGGALRALQRHLLGARDPRDRGRRRQFGHLPADHVEAAEDDGEQIVEVVRDAAGELADRFHLLRLPEQFLGLLASLVLRFQLRACVP